MADEKNPLPDVHPGNVAPLLCTRLGVPGVIVMISNEDGTISMIAHGISHARANEMLSRGVQINLNQHDDFVRRGFAGEAAQTQQSFVDVAASGVVQ